MTYRSWMLVAPLGAAFLCTAALSDPGHDEDVHGALVAADPTSPAKGQFRIAVHGRDAAVSETIDMNASRLGAMPDATGAPPVYDVVLVGTSGTPTADFGPVRLNRGGEAKFHFDSRTDSYPSGVTTVTAFGGGTFEVRHDATVVLTGAIPPFPAPPPARPGPKSTLHADSDLSATINGGAGRGHVEADEVDDAKGTEQRLRIQIQFIGTLGNPFTVTATSSAGVVTTLGTITTKGPMGDGGLTFDTRRGDTIPDGGISALSGQTIDVKNDAGTIVITGTFPTIP